MARQSKSNPETKNAQASLEAPQKSRRPEASHSEEQIARRAYEIYQARGGNGGDPQSDWFQAERELRGAR